MNFSSLGSGFLKAVAQFGNRPALEVERSVLSYAQLHELADSIARTLVAHETAAEPRLTAVFAYRSVVAFAGVLGTILRGHGYVPLNRTFPTQRSNTMLRRSGCRALIVDEASAVQLEEVLRGIETSLVLLFPSLDDVSQLAARWSQHRVLGRRDLRRAPALPLPNALDRDAVAYLLFTSGSTGAPKGVAVAQRNLRSYLDYIVARYRLTEEDRCSQTFDMTFDVSVHDMFVTWECGACLCCPTQKAMIKPDSFIKDSRLTVWFSVPSTAVFMKEFGLLKAGLYPGLRLSLFAGEALPMQVVKEWAQAAPNSIIENIYGPTELTITCTGYRWHPEHSPAECELGLVPIGEPFHGHEVMIADEHLRELPMGEPGELLVAGPQVAIGYWQDPERTNRAFVTPPGKDAIYYRTGDRVRRAAAGKPLVCLGRMDDQIKILGHRVELGEVEAVVREESGIDGIVAVGWPRTPGGAGGVEVFLQSEGGTTGDLGQRVARRLPVYMTPRRYHHLPRFPLNANGKFDRNALLNLLQNTP